MSEEDTHKKT